MKKYLRFNCIPIFLLLIFCFSAFPNLSYCEEIKNSDEILLGMSTALTGPAENLGKCMLAGMQAGFKRFNKEGGLNGKNIRIAVLDDGYEPSRTVKNINKLIDQENVLAIVGDVGTPTAIAALPIIKARQVLFFAPFTGAGVLRCTPPDRYVINFRASYAEEIDKMINGLINDLKFKPEDILFFSQRDGYGDAGFSAGVQALKKHGLKDEKSISHFRYERNTFGVEDAVAEILLLESDPKVIIMVGAYAPCAKFIKLVKENGLDPLFLNVSFVGSESLAAQLGDNGNGVIISQVVPPLTSDFEIVKDYLHDLKEFYPNLKPTFVSLEGYLSAKIFIKALKNMKDELTRESIIDALEELGDFDIGLGSVLTLNELDHQASHDVWITQIKDGQIIQLNNWKDLKR